jgi:diguanylate cyclase (GGDEF)-like protein
VHLYKAIKWSPLVLLSLHVVLSFVNDAPTVALDLFLYNSIVLLALLTLFQAPLHNDPFATACMALACALWGTGSIISSYGQFFSLPSSSTFITNISYTLFYPFALVAIPRAIGRRRKIGALEFLDSAIFGLGLSAIVTALVLSKVIPEIPGSQSEAFFSLLFPICDLILIIIVLISLVTHRLSPRLVILASGVMIFAATDFLFLWFYVNGKYEFGQLSDDGWLLGISLIVLSFWQGPSTQEKELAIHPVFIALSVFISPALLSAIAIRPDYFPSYILVPTIATLFLAFIRMTIVLRQARNLGQEKILARTDELTGLPNRRRLIAEISTFGSTEGALLLLDLNGFKPINDNYGHEMGDRVLRQVATRFSRSLPTGAILARLGGDEFGVLLSGGMDSTMEVAQALHATLSYPFLIDGRSISISVSIGHVQNDGAGDLLARADLAMYKAKRAGSAIVDSRN